MLAYYPAIKDLHITFVVLSFALFVTRGWWSLRASPRLNSVWARTIPHINDALLLAAGITLALLLQQYPFHDTWLSAKLVGLLAHIALGFVVFRTGLGMRLRVAAWLGSQASFFYIVAVAVTRNPWPWFG